MIDEILQKAETIAADQSPDDAARFLGPYRKASCEDLSDDPSKIGELLQITSAQVQYLTDANSPDKAAGIAEWFLHTLHHLEETIDKAQFIHIKRILRESFSNFFRRYARALRELDRIEDMRLAMRTSIDLTQEIPMAVVCMIHLYMPLRSRKTLEDLPAAQWLLDRYAEALAALDFSGFHDTPFRNAFDNYQFALRAPDQTDAIQAELEALCAKNSEDIALQTLYNLFIAGQIR